MNASIVIPRSLIRSTDRARLRKESVAASRDRLQPAQAVWLLSVFGALYQRTFNRDQVARQCAPDIATVEFIRLANELELDVQPVELTSIERLDRAAPVAVQMRRSHADGAPGNGDALEWCVVLQTDAERVLLSVPGKSAPETMMRGEFQQRVETQALRVRNKMPAADDPDVPLKQQFGFSWFVPELLKHRAIWRDVLTASLALQLIALAFPLFTQAVIDKVVVHRTSSTLVVLAVGMAVFVVFTGVLTWVRQYLVLHTGNRVDAVLGSHVFEHLFRLPPAYFQHRPTGVISARLQGVETIREFVSSAAITLLLDLPFLLIFVAVMFWYSVKLTLVVLAVLSVIVAASLLVAPLFQRRLNEQFQRGAANQAFLTEYVAGMETVKSLQLEPQLNRRYRDLLASFLTASFRTRQLSNSYGTLASTLEQTMSLLILVLGAWMVMTTASFTVGMLVAFQMFASRISQPLLRLSGLWQQFQQARLAVVRLGDLMNAPTEPHQLAQSRSSQSRGAVEIRDLAFRYADNLPLLYEEFNLTAEPGRLIALMGPSGAGKSTLAKLLQGFYQPTHGAIRIDGIDIRNLSANELRSHFGVVPQETTLFSGTILDNLKLANPFSSFEQVTAACRMAEIHSVIEALPNGYQTQIGERGAGLSGGQRQRISIARALLKGSKVLIFDEATSSVDQQTAEQLGRTINALKGRATILFIAHALPKTLHADQIVRIGDKLSVVAADRRNAAGSHEATATTVRDGGVEV